MENNWKVKKIKYLNELMSGVIYYKLRNYQFYFLTIEYGYKGRLKKKFENLKYRSKKKLKIDIKHAYVKGLRNSDGDPYYHLHYLLICEKSLDNETVIKFSNLGDFK